VAEERILRQRHTWPWDDASLTREPCAIDDSHVCQRIVGPLSVALTTRALETGDSTARTCPSTPVAQAWGRVSQVGPAEPADEEWPYVFRLEMVSRGTTAAASLGQLPDGSRRRGLAGLA
jgi:hypothetical protein